MNIKYIGMDIHKETISIAVMNGEGKVVMESIIETKASTILQCIQGVHGDLHVTLEEGTWAAWLYDLLKPHVTELVVCDPRRNALMKEGNKSDKIDACKLADLLRGGYLRSVYHGENGLRTLKELARSYLTISKDLTRAMNRVKALYRSWGILCGGQQVYALRHRTEWLNKIGEAGVRRRAEFFYQQLDALRELRQTFQTQALAGDANEPFSLKDGFCPVAGGYSGPDICAIAPVGDLYFSEFSMQYLALFLLSSLMRYRPQTWTHAISRSVVP